MNTETSTSWWIHKNEFKPDTLINLKAKMSVLSFRDNDEIPKAIFEDGDYIIIPKIKKSILDSILRKPLIFSDQKAPVVTHVTKWNKMKWKPLGHQIPLIDSICKIFSDQHQPEQRVFLCAKPGLGKTFMTAEIINRLGLKFIFITYSSKLVTQSYEDFCKYMGKDGMLCLRNGSDFEDINWKKVNGLFLTHRMVQSLINTYGIYEVIKKFMLDMNASIKIIDECDREVGSTYMLECFGNFSHNLYLTGTKFKNIRQDDVIFQAIYRHVHTFGSDVQVPNNRNCYIIKWRFNPSRDEHFKMSLYEEQLFKTYYNNYLANKDVLLDYIMWRFYIQEDGIIKKMIKEGGSIVLYCGRIENCEMIKKKLINNFKIDENDIGIYNSSIANKEKEIAETKTWIITTTESMGRGYDNPNLRVLVFLEFNFGISSYIQNVSRVARVGGKEGYVIEGLDTSFWKVEANHKKKLNLGIYKDYFKQITYFNIPDAIQAKYVNGYRPDSERAKEIKEKMVQFKKKQQLHKLI